MSKGQDNRQTGWSQCKLVFTGQGQAGAILEWHTQTARSLFRLLKSENDKSPLHDH